MSSPTGISVFNRALAALHVPCRALIMPDAVLLDAGSKRPPMMHALDTNADPLAELLSTAVGDMLKLMDQAEVRGRRVQVAVSDHWARPALLTLPEKPQSDEAIDAMLTSHYRRIYGELMDGWRWCWSQHGTRLTAVAWPAGALDTLQTGLTQRNCVLSCAKPLGLMLGAQLGKEPGACWLAVLARPSVTLMRLQNGVLQEWCVMSGMLEPSSLPGQLPLQLAREAARHGDKCRSLVIIDFDAATDLPLVRKNLLDAGWSSRICAASELSSNWVWRLQRFLGNPVSV